MESFDLVLWVLAFVCFLVATFVGDRIGPRFNLIAAGLALGALTFITG